MKKRIISMILTLVMLFTSVMVMLPVTASEANDLATIVTAALAESDTATVTLDADVTASDFVSVPEGKTLTIEGNEKTYKSVYGFVANGGTLIVKNMNVVLASGTTNAFGDVRNGGTLTFENCDFSAEAEIALTAKGHFVVLEAAANDTTMNLTNCEISIVASNNGGCMFYSEVNNSTVNLDKVTLDTSANPNLSGFVTKDGGTTASLNIKNGSDIKFAINAINFPNVTVESSNVAITKKGNFVVFNYNGKSAEINVDIKGDSRIKATNDTSGSKVMNVTNCSGGANITVTDAYLYAGNCIVYTQNNSGSFNFTTNGSAKLESSSWVIYNSPNTAPINLEFNGNTEITAPDGGIYACGTSCDFSLTMNDNAIFYCTKGDAIATNHGNNAVKSATHTFNDNSVVIAKKKIVYVNNAAVTTINAASTATFIAGDKGFDARKEFTSNIPDSVWGNPAMLDGASIRIAADSNGLRFTSVVKENTYIVEYGTLIVKNADLGATEFTIDALKAAGVTYGQMAATDNGVIDNGNGTVTYNFALTNLPEDQLTTMFAARAYVVYEINGQRITYYSDFTEENVRSISMVAKLALEDVKAEVTDVDGEYDYIYYIDGVGYSRYTADQYAQIATFVVAE